VAVEVLTGEKGGDGAPTDFIEGKRSQALRSGRLASEEGGEAFGEVSSTQERREQGWHRWLFETMAARWCGRKGRGKGHLQARPCGQRRGSERGGLARQSAARGGRQQPLTVGHGQRRCLVNR
jgi:hypothetical protein